MMERLKATVGVGGVWIGNENWVFSIPCANRSNEIDIYIGTEEDIKSYSGIGYYVNYIVDFSGVRHNLKYISYAFGKFGILKYNSDHLNKETPFSFIKELNGRFCIYKSEKCVVFMKQN